MPEPFKKQIVEYRTPEGTCRTPDGKRVTKDTPGAVRRETESPCYYGTVAGKQVRLARTMEASRRMLNKLLGDASLGSVGIRDRFAEHRDRKLLEHLDDYKNDLLARGNCEEHVAKTFSQCQAVIEGCEWTTTEDIDQSAVLDFLARLRQRGSVPSLPRDQERFTVHDVAYLCGINPQSVRRMENRKLLEGEGTHKSRTYSRAAVQSMLEHRARGISIETSNHYLTSIKGFSRWLTRARRVAVDELLDLQALNADTDKRHERRALTTAELDKFLEAAAEGKVFRDLDGPARIVLYCVAARTGLRASELASLTPESLDLTTNPPTLTVQAGYSKHRRRDVLPLRADTAELLRVFCQDLQPGELLWPGTWPDSGAEMIRFDLEAAGIPYRDRQGRVLDFHGLRHTFLTHMANSGLHPKVAQLLARHSTIQLTMDRYTHLDVLNLAGDLEKMTAVVPKKVAENGQRQQA